MVLVVKEGDCAGKAVDAMETPLTYSSQVSPGVKTAATKVLMGLRYPWLTAGSKRANLVSHSNPWYTTVRVRSELSPKPQWPSWLPRIHAGSVRKDKSGVVRPIQKDTVTSPELAGLGIVPA